MESINPTLKAQALEHLKKNLGGDFEAFAESLEQKPKRAIRVNSLKADLDEITAALCLKERAAYSPDSFIAPDSLSGDHPYHRAGLFYMQEPSAMLPIEAARPFIEKLLAEKEYPLVLDLCAAPGGKTGQIAALMKGRGAILSNETVFKRARALASNVERLGIRNALVTSDTPDKIAALLSGTFDVVIVDAPCSGEGMLRKESYAWENMNEKTMRSCAERQSEIMRSAVSCAREGGLIVYSTCTLNSVENEEVLRPFINGGVLSPILCPHLSGVRQSRFFPAYRAFPQDGGGEGHFVCVMRKTAATGKPPRLVSPFDGVFKNISALKSVLSPLSKEPLFNAAYSFGDSVILSPTLPFVKGLSVVKAGVRAASGSNRLIPDHAYAAALTRNDAVIAINLKYETGNEDEKATGKALVEKYLRGEELDLETVRSGFGLLGADGYVLGLVKISGEGVKNHYPKGLRKA